MELTNRLADQLQYFSEYLQKVGSDLFREAFKIHRIRTLSVQQLRYLEIIENNPGVTPGTLADTFQVRKPTVSNILAQLEKNTLIRREQSGDDKRVSLIFPTDVTVAIFRKRRSMYAMLASHIRGKLSESEIQSLVKLLEKTYIQEADIHG